MHTTFLIPAAARSEAHLPAQGLRRHIDLLEEVADTTLDMDDRDKANRLSIDRGGIGIGVQCWGLKKKLLEIDSLMTPMKQRVVHEVHPEVSFCEMNGGRPLAHSKKTPAGERQRIKALKDIGFPQSFLAPLRSLRSGRDDFLDACAALWTAQRIYQGVAKRLQVPISRSAMSAVWTG